MKKNKFNHRLKTGSKLMTVAIIMLFSNSLIAKALVNEDKVNSDFCNALNKIIADYPNGFENIKAKKHTGERSWGNYYTSKVNPEGVLQGKISGKAYDGYFAKEMEDYNEANRIFANLQRNLETCRLPFLLRKAKETEDKGDRKIVYKPVGALNAFDNMQIVIEVLDAWWVGLFVKLRITSNFS